MMKEYSVEFKEQGMDEYQNWLVDEYVEAESEEEAEDLAKTWLVENGYDGDVDDLFVWIRVERTKIGTVNGQDCFYNHRESCVDVGYKCVTRGIICDVDEAIERASAELENFKPVQ